MYNPGSPLTHRHRVGIGPDQAQKAQRRTLFHWINRVPVMEISGLTNYPLYYFSSCHWHCDTIKCLLLLYGIVKAENNTTHIYSKKNILTVTIKSHTLNPCTNGTNDTFFDSGQTSISGDTPAQHLDYWQAVLPSGTIMLSMEDSGEAQTTNPSPF